MSPIMAKSAPGVPEPLREVARKSKPSMEIVQSGESWSIKTTVGDTVKDTTFKVGEEFESKSLTGQNLKCIVTMDGDKMTEVQTAGDVKVVVTREVQGNELVSKMAFGDAIAVVKFSKA